MKELPGYLILALLVFFMDCVAPCFAANASFSEEIKKLNLLDRDFMMGYSLTRSGHHREAIDCFTKAIDRDPYDSAAYYRRGLSYLALNEQGAAVQDFELAASGIQVDSQDLLNYRNPDSFCKGEQTPNVMISILNKVIEEHPDDADAFFNRGTAHLKSGRLDQAVDDFSQAIELKPQDLDYHYYRKIALQRSDASQRLIPPVIADDLSNNKRFRDQAQVWNALKPYLPSGTRLTSVHRSAREQLDLIVQMAKKHGYRFPKPPSINDESSWQGALRFVCGKGYKVAAPGKSHHAGRIAYDLTGPDLRKIEAGVRKAAADGRIILRRGSRSSLLVEPPPQNCVHLEIEA